MFRSKAHKLLDLKSLEQIAPLLEINQWANEWVKWQNQTLSRLHDFLPISGFIHSNLLLRSFAADFASFMAYPGWTRWTTAVPISLCVYKRKKIIAGYKPTN